MEGLLPWTLLLSKGSRNNTAQTRLKHPGSLRCRLSGDTDDGTQRCVTFQSESLHWSRDSWVLCGTRNQSWHGPGAERQLERPQCGWGNNWVLVHAHLAVGSRWPSSSSRKQFYCKDQGLPWKWSCRKYSLESGKSSGPHCCLLSITLGPQGLVPASLCIWLILLPIWKCVNFPVMGQGHSPLHSILFTFLSFLVFWKGRYRLVPGLPHGLASYESGVHILPTTIP